MSAISHPALHVGHLYAALAQGWAGRLRARMAEPQPLDPATVCLSTHGSRSLTSFRGGTIACIQGCVWLTHDGDCRDIVLEAGQSHVADRDSRLVVHALERSTVRFAPAG